MITRIKAHATVTPMWTWRMTRRPHGRVRKTVKRIVAADGARA
jgi:hypothetical protein